MLLAHAEYPAYVLIAQAVEDAQKALTDWENQEQIWREQADALSDAQTHLALWEKENREAQHAFEALAHAKLCLENQTRQETAARQTQEDYRLAREAYLLANQEYISAQNALLDAQAGFLAREKLKPGQPCPVCGSLEHPAPCPMPEQHRNLTREGVDALAERAAQLQEKQTQASAQAGAARDVLEERTRMLVQAMDKLRQSLAEHLEQWILNENLPAGTRLPGNRLLAEHFRTTPLTIGKSLNELTRKGLLERRVGAGTFVANSAQVSNRRIGIICHEIICPDTTYISPVIHNFYE